MSRMVSLKPRGGALDTPQESSLQPGYAESLTNYSYGGGSWRKRSGFRKLHATPYADAFRGIIALKEVTPDSETWTLIVGTKGTAPLSPRFAKLVGQVFVVLPFNAFSTLGPVPPAPDNDLPWRFAATSNTVAFACRRATGGILYHVTKSQVSVAGIAPPTTAPTVADSVGAGTLTGGTYGVCCYTFVTADGQESSASPTTSATIGANKKRAWSGLEISPHPRVVARRLYVPLNAGVIPYLAIDITNNTATTFEEEVPDSDLLGEPEAPTRNGLPPDEPEDCFVFQEQLFVMNRDGWHFTGFDAAGPQFEAYDSSRRIGIAPRGGRRPTGGGAVEEDRAVLFTDSSAHWLVPDGDGYRMVELSLDHGLPAPSCWAVCDGVLVWFDGRNVVRSDGGVPRVVSRGWRDQLLKKVPAELAQFAVCVWHSEKGRWMLSLPSTPDSTTNDLVLVYDVERDEWCDEGAFYVANGLSGFLGTYKAPACWARIPAPDRSDWITVAAFDSDHRVMEYDSPARRDEGPINVHGQALTAPILPATPGGQIAVRRVMIGVDKRKDIEAYVDTGLPTFRVRLRLNGNASTSQVTASPSALGKYAYAEAQNIAEPADLVQIEFSEDFDNFIEIFDVQAEVIDFARGGDRS